MSRSMRLTALPPSQKPSLRQWLSSPITSLTDTLIRRAAARVTGSANIATAPMSVILATAAEASTGYDSGTNTAPWKSISNDPHISSFLPTSTSINELYSGSGARLRDQSRHFHRTNALAKQGLRIFTSNLFGNGIIPRPSHPDQSVRDILTDAWDWLMRNGPSTGMGDGYGLLRQLVSSWFIDGEAFLRYYPTRSTIDKVPLEFQSLAADHCPLDSVMLDSTKQSKDTITRLGIESDTRDRRINYWLHPHNPNDISVRLSGNPSMATNLAQPVATKYVSHLYHPEQIGQLRGIPFLHPVMYDLHQLEEYGDATLIRARVASLIVFWIEQQMESRDSVFASVTGDAMTTAGSAAPSIPLGGITPGAVVDLPYGKKASSNSISMDLGYRDFMTIGHRKIASGLGLLYEELSSDYAGVTFSSVRAARLVHQRYIEQLQYTIVVPQVLQMLWNWMTRQLALTGRINPAAYLADPDVFNTVNWCPPAWPLVDPESEVKAQRLATDALFTSRESVVASRGEDIEKVDAALAREQERERKLKLERRDNTGRDPKSPTPPPSAQSSGQK